MSTNLPQHVVKKDAELTSIRDKAQEELAQLRWHWTLDESNAERLSVRAYTKQVKGDRHTIQSYADGYSVWVAAARPQGKLPEFIKRAKVSEERAAKIEAVAEATGLTFSNVETGKNEKAKRAMYAASHAVDTAKAEAEGEGKTLSTDEIKAAAKKGAEIITKAPKPPTPNHLSYARQKIIDINSAGVHIAEIGRQHLDDLSGEDRKWIVGQLKLSASRLLKATEYFPVLDDAEIAEFIGGGE